MCIGPARRLHVRQPCVGAAPWVRRRVVESVHGRLGRSERSKASLGGAVNGGRRAGWREAALINGVVHLSTHIESFNSVVKLSSSIE